VARTFLFRIGSLGARQALGRGARGVHASRLRKPYAPCAKLSAGIIPSISQSAQRSENPIGGLCLITSGRSFEMVQKAVTAGFASLVSAGSADSTNGLVCGSGKAEALFTFAPRRAASIRRAPAGPDEKISRARESEQRRPNKFPLHRLVGNRCLAGVFIRSKNTLSHLQFWN